MAFTPFETSTTNISTLSDRPNQNDGLSSAQLKGRFDKAGNDIKTYLNDVLLEELKRTTDGDSGADNIGATAVGDGAAETVQGILEEIDADVTALDSAAVHLTGNETIDDVKTFSSSPIVPAPTTDTQASTKKYVDDADVLKVNITDIVNDLTTGGTAVPLSAEQGKTLQGEVGALASLATTEKGSLVGAINEVDDHADTNATSIGTLASLTTTEKTNLVGAINELDADIGTHTTAIGTLASLTTTEKTNLVGAINEVDADVGTNATAIGTLASLTTTEKTNLVGAINELDTDKVETSAITNTLTETGTGKVLDARQGRTLSDFIGDQTYTEKNYIADGESATESIDKLDMSLKDTADLVSTNSQSISQLEADLDSENLSDTVVTFPYYGTGAINCVADAGTKFYNSTKNIVDILNITDGTYVIGNTPESDQITVTVSKNTIQIVGTLSTAKYCVISDHTGEGYSYIKTSNYLLPLCDGLHLYLYNRTLTSMPSGAALVMSNGASGNVTSMNVSNAGGFVNFNYPATYGSLYLYLVAGTYNATFSIAMGIGVYQNSYDDNYSGVTPNTETITDENPTIISRGCVSATATVEAKLGYSWDRLTATKYSNTIGDKYTVSFTPDSLINIRWVNGNNDRILSVQIKRIVNAAKNTDTWHLYNLKMLTPDGISLARIAPYDLEWEGVLYETGDSDFVGGVHGQELQTSAVLLVDNVQTSLTPAASEIMYARNIKLIVKSSIYSRLASEKMADRLKIIEWSEDKKIKITNKFTFARETVIRYAFLCMASVYRSLSGYDMSKYGMLDDTYTPDDISTSAGGAIVNAAYYPNIASAWTWGDDLSVQADYTPLAVESGAGCKILVNSDAINYNKIYYQHVENKTYAIGSLMGGTSVFTILTK